MRALADGTSLVPCADTRCRYASVGPHDTIDCQRAWPRDDELAARLEDFPPVSWFLPDDRAAVAAARERRRA